jgi:hypothetical protein
VCLLAGASTIILGITMLFSIEHHRLAGAGRRVAALQPLHNGIALVRETVGFYFDFERS